ncbi:MFS general substrate transporter [Sanghuangporus baumii]|uniref:MFS general substrate transporter n=1 Tax=Sanghuangporus baumii TaxID=108892 RepID=A0A9Q5HW22_SANBA|nr:MFS general substrate transporter [Sanghuangporus baumii]
MSGFQAAAVPQLSEKYKASDVVISLGLSGYVLGFSFGPVVCESRRFVVAIRGLISVLGGPLSEMYGRRVPYLFSWPLLVATCAPCAYVNNLAVILFFRFMAGCCAGCALNNGTGILTDLYMSNKRAQGIAIAVYAASVFAGPCIALPVGFLIAAYAGPELWVLRVYFLFTATLLPMVFLLPETHGPTILATQSERMRRRGIPNAWAAHELELRTTQEFVRLHIGRPISMLFREPIIQAAALWTSLAYGITYLFFEVYPVVFCEQYNFPLQLTGLPFLAMIIGFLAAIALNQPLVRLFCRLPLPAALQPEDTDPDSPEARLKLSLFACVLIPASLFWFAWTSGGEVHWIVPTLAGIPFGFAAITIFFVFLTYTAETYTVYSNSASVCNTFCRSTTASIFPLVASSLTKSLGIKWGVSLFAFLSLGLIPIPLIFLRYGASIRARSFHAQEATRVVARMGSESGLITRTSVPRNSSVASGRRDQVPREVHPSLSLASLRTTGTVVSESGTLVDGGPKPAAAGIMRCGIDSIETIELTRMDARASDFPVPPLK